MFLKLYSSFSPLVLCSFVACVVVSACGYCVLNLKFGIRFDVDGYITGFGNPDWVRTHSAATSTAVAVLAVLKAGATCVGKAVMDEMAYRSSSDMFLFV